jgi:3-hydroxybutyryl-CoA dehydrogenase
MMRLPVIGVVGLGTMGLGIAQVYAAAGFQVLATDVDPVLRARALPQLSAALAARVAAGRLGAEERDATLANLHIGEGLADLAEAQMIVEAIVERLEAKRVLIAGLEALVAPDAVLATNTSSLSVAALAAGATYPQRIIGLHFFNPAPAMRLVELIGPEGASPAALMLARDLTEAAGKTVIDAPDRPGFIVNRCARPYYGEALAMLEEGRDAAGIDAAMVRAGYPMGPFSLIDLIGADINLATTVGLFATMDHHPRYHVFDALKAQVAKGDLGRKTGRGFLFPDAPGRPPPDAKAIALRIEAVLVNEAAWLLAGGGVTQDGIDMAMKLGLNFPRGPFRMLATHGPARIRATLASLEAATPLKGRYAPAPMLAGS